jgi:hypothetical protein
MTLISPIIYEKNITKIMRISGFDLRFLLISLLAAAALWFATNGPGLNLSGIFSNGEDKYATDVKHIREQYPIRLLQPEWVSHTDAGMWFIAEMTLRFRLIVAAWLGCIIVLVWKSIRKARMQQIDQARGHAQRLNKLREQIAEITRHDKMS